MKLRSRLMRKPIVVAPGVYDAFTALVAEQARGGTSKNIPTHFFTGTHGFSCALLFTMSHLGASSNL